MTPTERRLYLLLEKLLFAARLATWKRCAEHTGRPHATCSDCRREEELLDAYWSVDKEVDRALNEIDLQESISDTEEEE